MGDVAQVLAPVAVTAPPPIWLGGAPQLGDGWLVSFFGGRILSPSPCLGRLGRSLCCSRGPPSVVGLVAVAPAPSVVYRDSAPQAVAPAPSVVYRDSAPQLVLAPPSEVLHSVGVSLSAAAVLCCASLFSVA